MKQKIIIPKTKNWTKTIEDPSGLVIFIPGVLTDVSSSGFLSILKVKAEFDILVYDVYGKANSNNFKKNINDLVIDFEHILKSVKKGYKKIFIISYSSGSEILLRAKLPPEVKAMALWSPSFFYPQNVTDTLKSSKSNKDILIHENTLIGRNLAENLDSLNTMKLINSIYLPICIYSSLDEQDEKSWANPKIFKLISSKNKKHINIPYRHIYTKEQITSLYYETCRWFIGVD